MQFTIGKVRHRINEGAISVLLRSPTGGVARDMYRRGLRVQAQARRNLDGGSGKPRRVDTGLLRASVYVRAVVLGGAPAVRIGSAVKYACILGGNTRVTTDGGQKAICQVQPGDLVLTQTGDFRRVLACTRFPVTEKPDLVEIQVPWRDSSPPHILTVTADHQILVARNGVRKWVQAGELLVTDELHIRTKLAHNKNTGQQHVCGACGRTFDRSISRGKRFCSWACRDEYWRQHGHWMRGRQRGAMFSARQSVSRARLCAERPEIHPNHNQPRVTSVEKTVAMWLFMRGVAFEHRKHIAGLWPDFYVPAEHRVYEADGAYWHQDQRVDIDRDRRITDALPGVSIVHVHFREPRFTPDLDPNPLPNVYYVMVNPGTKSYVEPTVFETRRPTVIRRYQYERSTTPRASKVPLLYDLAVEGIHSFLANGLLVSNSLVHDGTGLYGPRHAPITPKKGNWLVFTPKGGKGKVFVRSVRGMRPNQFLADALIAAKY